MIKSLEASHRGLVGKVRVSPPTHYCIRCATNLTDSIDIQDVLLDNMYIRLTCKECTNSLVSNQILLDILHRLANKDSTSPEDRWYILAIIEEIAPTRSLPIVTK